MKKSLDKTKVIAKNIAKGSVNRELIRPTNKILEIFGGGQIPLLQVSKGDPNLKNQATFERSEEIRKEIERGLKQFADFNRINFTRGRMDPMDRADLNDAALTVINSPRGGDTTNNITTNNVGIRNGDPVLLDLHALHRGG